MSLNRILYTYDIAYFSVRMQYGAESPCLKINIQLELISIYYFFSIRGKII